MAITKVADGQAAAATISLASTGVAAGDLVIVHAYRNASTTAPTVPGTWTTIIADGGANTNSRSLGYRVIQAGDTLSSVVGTWTNATAIQFIALQGYLPGSPIGGRASGGTNTATLATPTVTMIDATGVSWVVAFAGSKATNANSVTLSSTTDEVSSQGALNLATGRAVASYSGRNYSATVNASGNRMDAVEVRALDAKSLAPGAASLTVTGSAPFLLKATHLVPAARSLVVTGAVPALDVTTSSATTITPASASLAVTGSVPALARPVAAQPAGASLIVSGSAPALTRPVRVQPAATSLTTTGSTPALARTANQTVTPGAAALIATGATPTVHATDHKQVAPAAASLALSLATPTLARTDNIVLTPASIALSLSLSTPSVSVASASALRPAAASLTLTGAVPSLARTDHKRIVPSAAALAMTGFAPDLVLSDHKLVTPGGGSLAIAGAIPSIRVRTGDAFETSPLDAPTFVSVELPDPSAGAFDTAALAAPPFEVIA